jgi:hypothetical protein
MSTLQKCKYNGLKLMRGTQIWIRFDRDLFGQIGTLQGAMAVPGEIFQAHIPIGIPVFANPPDLRFQILNLWTHCSMNCSSETAEF